MYSKKLIDRLITQIAPKGYTERADAEARYPRRTLVDDAVVTRSAPSPTGFVHIGTIYMSMINKLVALTTGGVNMLRVEDTDKKREAEGGLAQIIDALEMFNLLPDEGVDRTGHSYGIYGPYLQSERADIYLGFAIDLLKKGRAYPCFADSQELEKNYKEQQAAKVRPGYYGKWAIWRDKTEQEISEALDKGLPFVLRFRSAGSHDKRVTIPDVLKGTVQLPENDLDVPLIKNDEHRLPTYHLAHVVDDYLMQTNIILRGDEWLPSTPLHIELAEALDIKPFTYAHFAPISILDKGSKRKLSKRKDPQSNVVYFIESGYPVEAILQYLLGLANSNYEDWRLANPGKPIWDFKFSFDKWAKARGALYDQNKLDDVSKNFIAGLSQEAFEEAIINWAQLYSKEFADALKADPAYTSKVLAVERNGAQKRKDVAKWADAPVHYGYFFDEWFMKKALPQVVEELEMVSADTIEKVCKSFLSFYKETDEQTVWLSKFRDAAESLGMSLKDYAQIIRVKLTGMNRSPDLYLVLQTLGIERVKTRLS